MNDAKVARSPIHPDLLPRIADQLAVEWCMSARPLRRPMRRTARWPALRASAHATPSAPDAPRSARPHASGSRARRRAPAPTAFSTNAPIRRPRSSRRSAVFRARLSARRARAADPAFGDFDFYVLSLSWSPGFAGRRPAPAREPMQSGAGLGFVVHGLWPQYEHGYPQDCPYGAQTPSRIALQGRRASTPARASPAMNGESTASARQEPDGLFRGRPPRMMRSSSRRPSRTRQRTRTGPRSISNARSSLPNAIAPGMLACLRAARAAGGEDLLFEGSARLSQLPGGRPARLSFGQISVPPAL